MVKLGKDLWAVLLMVHTKEEITSSHRGSGTAAQAPTWSLTRIAQWGVVESPVRMRGLPGLWDKGPTPWGPLRGC